jgi:hypothetical protein
LLVAALSNIDVIVWLCFVLGVLVLGTGVVKGFVLDRADASVKKAKSKIDHAKSKIDETKNHIQAAGVEGIVGVDAQTSAANASASADEARSALQEVGDIITALPENLRFSGLLVLIGTVLIGVATIQFGQVSLF